ncbi:MAG TPA: glycosyltransferase [Methylomirabilota bacterium]
MTRAPILFYCQHLLGLGHLERAARLARALGRAGEPVVFVQGGRPVPDLDVGGAEVVQLPPLVAADEAASSIARPDGRRPAAADLDDRRGRLLACLRTHDPSVVLLELFPFGRHALAFELGPLLLAAADDRARRGAAAPRVAVSLRDVLVSKPNQAWFELAAVAVARQWTDRVLVHGSPDAIPLDRTVALAGRLGDRLVYTGYLGPDALTATGPPHGEVVISGGGGQVAGPLFRAALAAWPLTTRARTRPWRLVTGPYLPEAVRSELGQQARGLPAGAGHPAVVVEAYRPDLGSHLGGAALSVSQAGYNTVLELIAHRVRAVVVPYEGSGDEQPLRAGLLAERGLLEIVREAELTPARLAAAMDAALERPGFPAPVRLDLGGAARSVEILRELAAGVRAARAQGPGRHS